MKKTMLILILISMVLAFAACQKEAARLAYPVTKKVDQVDDYFGTKVADPYRWLEDDNAEDVKAWVKAAERGDLRLPRQDPVPAQDQGAADRDLQLPALLVALPGRRVLLLLQERRPAEPVASSTSRRGSTATPEVFIDPNALSPDGTVRVGIIGASSDDKYVAVSRGEAGSDWSEIRVMEIATKKELPDRIEWIKFSGAAWQGDGFYYSGYDKPAPGEELKAKNEYPEGLLPQARRPAGEGRPRLRGQGASAALRRRRDDRGREVPLPRRCPRARAGTELYCKDLAKKDAPFDLLVKGFANDSSPIEVVDDKVLVYTNDDAPNFRVVAHRSRRTRPRRTGGRSSPRSPRS